MEYKSINYTLDYLLEVETSNGEIIKQDIEDKSYKGGPSFYYDIKDLDITKATLVGKKDVISVNLIDGTFVINGKTIYPSCQYTGKLSLVYYRQVQQFANWDNTVLTPLTPIVKYFIGWKVPGTDIEKILGVD